MVGVAVVPFSMGIGSGCCCCCCWSCCSGISQSGSSGDRIGPSVRGMAGVGLVTWSKRQGDRCGGDSISGVLVGIVSLSGVDNSKISSSVASILIKNSLLCPCLIISAGVGTGRVFRDDFERLDVELGRGVGVVRLC